MAKERLGKLQKWILEKCYERRKTTFLFRREITLHLGGGNSAEATTSRTIKNLVKKGWVVGIRGRKLIDDKGGFDYALELAIRANQQKRKKDEYVKELQELLKKGGKNEKYPSPCLPDETIKALQLTKEGERVAILMLSYAKPTKT